MENQILQLCIFFILYSFLGWVMESIIRTVCEKRIVNTGFLYGPFCPIYGIGALIMFLFLERFKNNIFLLFFTSFIILSAWEYIVGWMLEKIFRTKYWDYSDHKCNIRRKSLSYKFHFLGNIRSHICSIYPSVCYKSFIKNTKCNFMGYDNRNRNIYIDRCNYNNSKSRNN